MIEKLPMLGVVALVFSVFAWSGEASAGDDTTVVPLTASYESSDNVSVDLDELENRLASTSSIGLFSKLALKSELGALIDEFSYHHDRGKRDGLGDLLRRFERLMFKTMDMVRADDPTLYAMLLNARPDLRLILTDPLRFSATFSKKR